MFVADWALMRACATEVLAEARVWWPHGNDTARSQLAPPLKDLADAVAYQDARRDPTPRPAVPMAQRSLMWACDRASAAIRVTVRPDAVGIALWSAGARLAYVTSGIRAHLLAK